MKLAGPSQKYQSELLPCKDCPYRGPKVGSRGNPKAKIVFVGEAPGAQEITHKTPLVGPSGEVFWRTLPLEAQLKEWGLDVNDDILILNALQCIPPRSPDANKNTAIVAHGARICSHRLHYQVTAHPRDLVVACGNHAVRTLTGNYGYKITQIRGQLLPSPLGRLGLLPTVHPAALLRGTGSYRQYREDILYAFDLIRGRPPKAPVDPRHIVLRNKYQVLQLALALKDKPYIAADTETNGFDHLKDPILALGLSASPDLVYIVPGRLVPYTKALFRSTTTRFIWHNGKFDMRFVRPATEGAARCDEDTMLLSYALDESGGIHDLETVGNDLLGAPDYKHMLKPYLPKKSTPFSNIPPNVLHRYLALDTSNTLQIFHVLRAHVREDPSLEKLYTKVLMVASEFLYEMEMNGIGVLPNRVAHQTKSLQNDIDDAYVRLQTYARRAGYVGEVNPNSPQQLGVLLYDRLKLRSTLKVQGKPRSTAKAVLERMPDHPVIKGIFDFRRARKAKSTYVDSLKKNIRADGRVHPTSLIHGTRSGRLSSRGPNMQNIPRGTRIRSMYSAKPRHVYIKADLNQAELRSLAILSRDRYLLEVYAPGSRRKLHNETAKDFFPGWENLDPKQGTGLDQLMRAKAVNFGIVYGRQAPSIAEEFQIPVAEAQRWIDKWFERSPEAREFINKCRSAPLRGINLVTPFGRKKRHWIVTRENLNGLQNEASNFPHQSIAHDICLLGGAKATPLLRHYGVFPVNEVHDEVMFECPDDPKIIAFAKYVIIRCMESIAPEWGLTEIPFIAEADVGRRWGIYRNPKLPEYKYEYEPRNPAAWWLPNPDVVNAFVAFNSRAGEAGAQDKILLGGEYSIPAPDGAGAPSGDSPDSDPDDSDWAESDPEAIWGPRPSSELTYSELDNT